MVSFFKAACFSSSGSLTDVTRLVTMVFCKSLTRFNVMVYFLSIGSLDNIGLLWFYDLL